MCPDCEYWKIQAEAALSRCEKIEAVHAVREEILIAAFVKHMRQTDRAAGSLLVPPRPPMSERVVIREEDSVMLTEAQRVAYARPGGTKGLTERNGGGP